MKKMNELQVSVVPCSADPIRYDPEKCIGCNTCVRTCHCDVLLPSTEKGEHPIVAWPGECCTAVHACYSVLYREP